MSTQQQQRRGAYTGSTQKTLESGCMLGAKWWEKGDEIHALFSRHFPTKFGEGSEFLLIKPTSLSVYVDEWGVSTKKAQKEGQEVRLVTRFALPPLAGYEMAVQDLLNNGFTGFQHGDRCIIRCVEVQASSTEGYSNMPMFEISVDPR